MSVRLDAEENDDRDNPSNGGHQKKVKRKAALPTLSRRLALYGVALGVVVDGIIGIGEVAVESFTDSNMNSGALLCDLATLNEDTESSTIGYVSLFVVELSFILGGLRSGVSLLGQVGLAGALAEIVLLVPLG